MQNVHARRLCHRCHSRLCYKYAWHKGNSLWRYAAAVTSVAISLYRFYYGPFHIIEGTHEDKKEKEEKTIELLKKAKAIQIRKLSVSALLSKTLDFGGRPSIDSPAWP